MKRFGLSAAVVLGHNEFSGASTSCPGIKMTLVRARFGKGINAVADTQTPVKKEDGELEFSSPSLKAEIELTLGSKARREIIVNAAVSAGAQPFWGDRLSDGTITNGDILALAAKYTIAVNK